MAKITAAVHKTLKKLDAAIAIVAPKRGTNAAVVLANQLKTMLQSARPFEIKWGDDTRRVNSESIRIHKSTITFVLEDQEFDLQLSAIDYVLVGNDKNDEPRYEPGFYDEDKGISFVAVEVAAGERKARKAA
ncbi:hypothetical protein [Sphingomonas sp. 3-13AW]|uniref:hypothetical protein n=1 Tax=Sphingomonas sp. 3-13AW TaxID=3050450 RepID=UPI003BB5EA3B